MTTLFRSAPPLPVACSVGRGDSEETLPAHPSNTYLLPAIAPLSCHVVLAFFSMYRVLLHTT